MRALVSQAAAREGWSEGMSEREETRDTLTQQDEKGRRGKRTMKKGDAVVRGEEQQERNGEGRRAQAARAMLPG